MNSNFRSFTPTSKKNPFFEYLCLSPSLWFKQEEATSDNWHSPSTHLHNHHHHRHLHPVSLATPPIHLPLSSLHSSSSSFHRWAHSACSLSQQPRRVGLIPAVPGGAVAGPSTRFHLPLLAPRSGKPTSPPPPPPPPQSPSPPHKDLLPSALLSLSASSHRCTSEHTWPIVTVKHSHV